MKDIRYYVDVDKLVTAFERYHGMKIDGKTVIDEINKLSRVSMSLSNSGGKVELQLSDVCREISVADLLLYNENPHVVVCVSDQYNRSMAVDELWHLMRFRKDIWDMKVLSYSIDKSPSGEDILKIQAEDPSYV